MAYYPFSAFGSAFTSDSPPSQAPTQGWPTQQTGQLQQPQPSHQQAYQAQPQQTFYLLSPTTASAAGLSQYAPAAPKAKAVPVAVEGRDVKTRRFGVCKFFNPTKGFGFIEDTHPEELPIAEGDPGPDIFVHFSHIVASESPFKSLLDGESVEFTLGRSSKGLAAMEVTAPGGGPVKGNPLARSLSVTSPGLTSAVIISPMTLPIPMTTSSSGGMSAFEPYTVHAPTAWALPSHGNTSPNPASAPFYGQQQALRPVSGAFAGSPHFSSPFDHSSAQTNTSPWTSQNFAVTVGMPLFPGGPRSGHSQTQSLSNISQTSQTLSRTHMTAGTLNQRFEFLGRTGGALPNYLERDDPYRPAWQKLSQPQFVPQWSPPGGRRPSDDPARIETTARVAEMGRKLDFGEGGVPVETVKGRESPSKHLTSKGLSTPPLSPASAEFKPMAAPAPAEDEESSLSGAAHRLLYESPDVSTQTTNTSTPPASA